MNDWLPHRKRIAPEAGMEAEISNVWQSNLFLFALW
jgi:hypothetical protein